MVGGDEEEVSGDFAPRAVDKTELTVTLEIFRYCPTVAESGWDTVVCQYPQMPLFKIC